MTNTDLDRQLQAAFEKHLDGDPEARDRICHLLLPDLRQVAVFMLGKTDPSVDDVVHDTLISLLNVLRDPRDLGVNLRTYAGAIIRNCCRDLFRRRKVRFAVTYDRIEGILDGYLDDPLRALVEAETSQELARALAELEPGCLRLLKELFARERSVKELAAALKLGSVQLLYYHKNQCLKDLKNNFLKIPDRASGKRVGKVLTRMFDEEKRDGD